MLGAYFVVFVVVIWRKKFGGLRISTMHWKALCIWTNCLAWQATKICARRLHKHHILHANYAAQYFVLRLSFRLFFFSAKASDLTSKSSFWSSFFFSFFSIFYALVWLVWNCQPLIGLPRLLICNNNNPFESKSFVMKTMNFWQSHCYLCRHYELNSHFCTNIIRCHRD